MPASGRCSQALRWTDHEVLDTETVVFFVSSFEAMAREIRLAASARLLLAVENILNCTLPFFISSTDLLFDRLDGFQCLWTGGD